MHDPLYDEIEAGKALAQPVPFRSIADWHRAAIDALPLRPFTPTDPAIAAQRDRYRLNRAQRRAADRQEHA